MLFRLFSLLIPGDLDIVQRTKAKILASVLLVAITYCCSAFLLLDTIGSDFPNTEVFFAVLTLLVLLKVTGSVSLVGNLTVTMIFIAIATTSLKSGGIYSHDLPSLSFVILISFCTLGIRETIFYCLVVILFITYIYFQAMAPENLAQFNHQRNQFNTSYYLVLSLFMSLLPTILYIVLARMNSRLISDLQIANTKLDKINSALAHKSNKLSEAKTKLEESNLKLERYAHAASHDLKQPLRTIISFTQLIQRKLNKLDLNDSGLENYIQHVVNGTKRMESQVDDLLSFSSISYTGIIQCVDLNKVISEVQDDLRQLIEKNKVAFEVDNLPIVQCTRSTIAQVFQNLISNAIKYRKINRALKISIRSDTSNNMALICVADNGQGIQKENLDKIFDPYFQEEVMNAGHGIGLATSKQIIESHGGNIWVESQLGSGSTFCLTIPSH